MVPPMLLALLACTEPPPTSSPCPPGPGEILVLETGANYLWLDKAIGSGTGFRTVCLGEGVYETELELQELESGLLRGRLALVGAGSDRSSLVGVGEDPWVLRVASDLHLEGLRFELPVRVEGLSLELHDVAVADFTSEALPARFEGLEGLSVTDLALSGLEFPGRALELDAGEEAEDLQIQGLSLLGLRSSSGELAAFEHAAVVQDLLVLDNVALTNAPGAAGLSTARLELSGATLSGNELNGPVLAPAGPFEGRDIELRGNLSRVLGALSLLHEGALRDSAILDNSGGSGALSMVFVEPDREVLLEAVDLGEDSLDNSPCDVGLNTVCLPLELGYVEAMECSAAGCEEL